MRYVSACFVGSLCVLFLAACEQVNTKINPAGGNNGNTESKQTVAGECHSYFPLEKAGRIWNYNLTPTPGVIGTQTYTSGGIGSTQGQYKMHVETKLDKLDPQTKQSIMKMRIVYDQVLQCADNELSLMSWDAQIFFSWEPTAPAFVRLSMSASPPMLWLPKDVGLSRAYTSQVLFSSIVQGIPISVTSENTTTVEAEESVSVAAGAFNTIRINQVGRVMGQTAQNTPLWVAKGIGLIKVTSPPDAASKTAGVNENLMWELADYSL